MWRYYEMFDIIVCKCLAWLAFYKIPNTYQIIIHCVLKAVAFFFFFNAAFFFAILRQKKKKKTKKKKNNYFFFYERK